MPMAYVSVVGNEKRQYLDATDMDQANLSTSLENDEMSGEARIELEPVGLHEEIPKILSYLHRNL